MLGPSPVKYMVIGGIVGYRILYTSLEGHGEVIAACGSIDNAHKVARALNRAEGYEYPDEDPS